MPFVKKPAAPAAKPAAKPAPKAAPAKPSANAGKKSIQLTLPPGLGCYVSLFQPREFQNDGKPMYSVVMVWPKDNLAALAPLKQAIIDVATTKFGANAKELLKAGKLRMPLRDGDLEHPEDPVFAGCVFMNFKSKGAPAVVDRRNQRVLDEEKCYSGCTLRINAGITAYDNKSKGVAGYVNAVQVVEMGERLAGRGANAEEIFAEYSEADAEAKGATTEPSEDAEELEPSAPEGTSLLD